jgi:putative transposase
MANDTLKLTDREVLEYARTGLHEHLPLKAEGYKCSTEDLLNVLLGIGVSRGTVESVCTDLVETPNPETIRQYMNKQLTVERLPELERCLNGALAAEIPLRVWRHTRDIAIDFHDQSYYGKASQEEGLWVRGRAKDGTTRFYRVVTAYVILNGLRVTLAVHFVLPGEDTVTVLDILLHRVEDLDIPMHRLFLDKGFSGIDVMAYLSWRGLSAVLACPIRGKTGGTRALCRGRKGYRTPHTFKSQGGKSFTAELAVCRVFTTAKRTGRMKRRAEWLIFILINLELSPRQARRLYRRRFGIETSYRCTRQVRGWTTSLNPAYRFVLIGLSFFLLNVWLHLRWLFTQVPRRGRRKLDTARFQLIRFTKFALRALEHHYGCVHQITAPALPLP